MEWIKAKGISVGILYINLLFVMKLMEVFYKIQDFDYINITILFIFAMVIYWFYGVLLSSKLKKLLFTMLIIVLLVIVIILKHYVIYNYISSVINNYPVLSQMVYNSYNTNYSFFSPYYQFFIPVASIIILFAMEKGANSILTFITLAIMIIFWYTGYADQVKGYIFLFLSISLITYFITKDMTIVKSQIGKGANTNITKISSYVFVLCLSIGLPIIVGLLPQTFMGKIGSSGISRWTNQFVSNDNLSKGVIKEGLAISGYSDSNTSLGGPVKLNNDVVFKVKADKPYYLRGLVKNFYNGFSWAKSTSNQIKPGNLISTMKEYQPIKRSMEVTPVSGKTKEFFVPSYTYNIQGIGGKINYDSTFTYFSNILVNKKYTANFLDNKYSLFLNINTSDKLAKLPNGKEPMTYSPADLLNYNPELQVPDIVAEGVRNLTKTVTKGAKNNVEKVQKIYDFLSKNYLYTLSVNNVPKGEEFLNYFLNVEKKGYCTYFATATTIMCRLEGIPARYVEGYKITSKNKTKNDLYDVKNSDAHAWCEVLLAPDNDIWTIVDSVPNSEGAYAGTAIYPPIPIIGNKNTNPQIKDDLNNNANKSDYKYSHQLIIPLWAKVTAGITSFILLFILVRGFLYYRMKRYLLKNASVIPLYLYTNKRLVTINMIRGPFVGELEYVDSLNNVILKERLGVIVPLVYKEYFGSKSPNAFDRKEYFKFIEEFIKNRQNVFKYVSKKFF
ncbi:MAG TPA: transglutaminase domain-containing protein [Clostridiaceae bacterium]